MPWIEAMEELLFHIIEICIMLMELIGVCVMIVTAIVCLVRWIRKDMEVGLRLAQGIALALEFKLGGEVLRTVIVRDWAELGILGAIIALRGLLTLLIHWEINHERKAIEEMKAIERANRVRADNPDTEETEKPKDMMFS